MDAALTQTKKRIQSIDILRGVIMLIMALDHVRDFFHVHAIDQSPTDLATTTPLLFFTRWITHFCAPAFLLLSGVSAYLVGLRKTKKELSAFLIKRGLWLIVIDATVMTFALTLNPAFNLIVLSVLWAIGCSMIILGLLVRTNMTIIIVVACLIFFGHNIFDFVTIPKQGAASVLLPMFLSGAQSFYPITNTHVIAQFYVILPWTSVMMFGYVIGSLYRPVVDAVQRKKFLIATGVALTLLFIVLRTINIYGDPSQWSQQKNTITTFLSFLNTTKYPCSLDFLCMTLGPVLIVLALVERAENKFTKIASLYGRVPFFYYVGHFYLIRILCIILFFATGFGINNINDPKVPFLFRPSNFGFELWGVFLIWLLVIAAMYYPCKWFDNYKRTHHKWWLSYL
jgi:uncharacterized membrane protein